MTLSQFNRMIRKMTIPQLEGLRSEIVRQNQLVFNADKLYPLRLKSIDNEIKLATEKIVQSPGIWNAFQKPKSLNPYNALGGAVPKSAYGTPGIPAVAISEYVTYNSAQPIAGLYASAPDIYVGAKNAFGIHTAKRDKYTRAKDMLEWNNAARYYEWLLEPIRPGIEKLDFVPDELLDLPEYAEGKHMYKELKEKRNSTGIGSELLKAASNTYASKTHGEPGKGKGKIYYQKT